MDARRHWTQKDGLKKINKTQMLKLKTQIQMLKPKDNKVLGCGDEASMVKGL